MRLLITGGAGFIGRRVCAAGLAAGHDVRVLDVMLEQVHRGKPADLPAEVDLVVGDCRDAEVLKRVMAGVDVVVHLAALTGVGQSMYQAAEYTSVNCVGTAAVLQAVADAGSATRVVLASSRAVYGEGPHLCAAGHEWVPHARAATALARAQWEHRCPACGQPGRPLAAGEALPASASSVYGATKVAQEQLVMAFGESLGIRTAVLRYFNVYGAGQAANNPYTGIVGVFARAGESGRASDLYEDGAMLRDFVHVDDVVRATLRAAAGQLSGDHVVVNIGSGAPLTIADVATLIAELQGAPAPRVNGRYRLGDVRHCFADVEVARQALSFSATVALADGMRDYLGWFSTQELEAVPDASGELDAHGLGGIATAP